MRNDLFWLILYRASCFFPIRTSLLDKIVRPHLEWTTVNRLGCVVTNKIRTWSHLLDWENLATSIGWCELLWGRSKLNLMVPWPWFWLGLGLCKGEWRKVVTHTVREMYYIYMYDLHLSMWGFFYLTKPWIEWTIPQMCQA